MLNSVYQLITPKTISVKHEDVDTKDQVIIRPEYLALCHADQRYYQGKRDIKILRKKLPMALIHEACGRVIHDPTGTFKVGQSVVMIPNIPGNREEKVIYENYGKGGGFLSSGHDGFMREFVNLPADRVVAFDDIDKRIAAITEFISKLSQFSFVDETILADDLEEGFNVDHAFECAGGEGSFYAIDNIIKYINPQGTVMLMGVSENKVPINTRDILEKGLTFVGSSRSGRVDFENAIKFMEDKSIQRRLKSIIYETDEVKNISDIHKAFSVDIDTDFKTVFKWSV